MSKSFKDYRDELIRNEPDANELKEDLIRVRFDKVSVLNLALQKHYLLEALTILENSGLDSRIVDCEDDSIAGIVSMIDNIQDELYNAGFPDEVVYPFLEDNNGSPRCEAPDVEYTNYRRAMNALLKANHKDLPKYLNLDPELDKLLKQYFKEGEV